MTPSLLWMHGGAYFMGNVEQDDLGAAWRSRGASASRSLRRSGRHPQNPAPAALEDAYACLAYLHENGAVRQIDPERIAIGGTSAGGGLAASLALLAHDLGEVKPVFQLLAYPVLDDRSAFRTDRDDRNVRMYTSDSLKLTWRWYLGNEFVGQGGLGVCGTGTSG